MMADFHFMRPWFLVLLLLPLAYGWRFFRKTDNKSSWENVIDKNLLGFLLIKGSSSLRKMVSLMTLLGVVFAIVALAGPAWKKKDIPTLIPDNPVMILLSLSSDMTKADITPNRLARAKYKINDLLKLIPGAQAGLIVYTNEPFIITPLTSDLALIAALLDQIDFDIMPMDGDRTDRAIDLAAERLKAAGYAHANIVILAADGGQAFDLSLKSVQASGFKVSAINISKQEMDKLRLLSEKGNGVFANAAAGDEDVKKVAELINASIGKDLKLTENMRAAFEDFGYYLLIVPMLCCLYLFRKGIVAVILLLLWAWPAQAAFFLNSDQSGLQEFNKGEFAKAAKEFQDPKWKASALYKAGDFAAAAEEFARFDDITSQYNLANALAKGGKIEEAIQKYEAILKAEPNHEDAKFNLEYLKKQQQQQNQQQQNQNQDKQKKNEAEQQNQQQQNQPSSRDKDNSKEIAASATPPRNDTNGEQKKNNAEQQNQQQNQQQQNQNQDGQKKNDAAQPKDHPAPARHPSNGGELDKAAAQERKGDGGEKKNESQLAAGKPSDQKLENYNEETQAREQQYREIPDDPGGLLRAFIVKEYQKNRYGE